MFFSPSSECGDARCSYLLKIVEFGSRAVFLFGVNMTTFLEPPTLCREFLFYWLLCSSLAKFLPACSLFSKLQVLFPFNLHIAAQFSLISARFLLLRVHLRLLVIVWIFLRIFTVFRLFSLPPFCSSVLKPYLRKYIKQYFKKVTLKKKPTLKVLFSRGMI